MNETQDALEVLYKGAWDASWGANNWDRVEDAYCKLRDFILEQLRKEAKREEAKD